MRLSTELYYCDRCGTVYISPIPPHTLSRNGIDWGEAEVSLDRGNLVITSSYCDRCSNETHDYD